jgi:phage-related tail protein
MPDESDRKERLRELITQLEQERDELKVKLGLAKLEAREEWQELDKKMESLRGRMKVLSEEAKEASGDVGAAMEVVAEEVREGFNRLRKLM